MNRLWLVAGVAVAGALLGGCSSSPEPVTGRTLPSPPAPATNTPTYASTPVSSAAPVIPVGACQAASNFVQDLSAQTQQLGRRIQGAAATDDTSAIQKVAATYLGNAAHDATDAISALRASHPETATQQQARTAVLSGLADLQADFTQARDSVAGLDPSSPSFASSLSGLAQGLQSRVNGLGSRLVKESAVVAACPHLQP